MTDATLQPLGSDNPEDNASFDDFKHSTNATNRAIQTKRINKRNSSVPRKAPEFVIDNPKGMPDYNGLRDPHLHYHFYNKKLRKLLRRNGLLTKNGEVIEKRSCLNELETFKQSQIHKDLSFKPFERGTLVLSIKLPEIKQVPLTNFTKSQQQKPGQMKLYHESRKVERDLASAPPNKLQSLDTSVISNGQKRPVFLNPPKGSRFNSRTPIQSRSQRDDQDSTLNKSAEIEVPKRLKMGYHLPSRCKKELKPLSKDELQAIFDRYKKKLNDSSIVTELPEMEEMTSLDTKQDRKKKENSTIDYYHHQRSKSTFEVEKREIKVVLKTDYATSSYGNMSSPPRESEKIEENGKLNKSVNIQNRDSVVSEIKIDEKDIQKSMNGSTNILTAHKINRTNFLGDKMIPRTRSKVSEPLKILKDGKVKA